MEIKLDEAQKESIKLLVDREIDEKELLNQFVNIGILFLSAPLSKQRAAIKILKPVK